MWQRIINKTKEYFKKYRVYVGLVLIFIIILLGGIAITFGAGGGEDKTIKSEDLVAEENINTGTEDQEDKIVFDIEGAVFKPGVYRLEAGSVLADAIKAAGGLSRDADTERIAREINQASLVSNNSKIYIFTLKDREVKVVSAGGNANYSNTSSSVVSKETKGKINLNTATLQELDSLPKIGPVLAQRIIDWRDANGGFEIIEDIKKVKGIGDSVFNEINDQIIVE